MCTWSEAVRSDGFNSLGQLVVGSFADLGCEPVACYVQGQRAPLRPGPNSTPTFWADLLWNGENAMCA